MEGFIWYKDMLVILPAFLICLAVVVYSTTKEKKTAPRGATRIK